MSTYNFYNVNLFGKMIIYLCQEIRPKVRVSILSVQRGDLLLALHKPRLLIEFS